MTLRMIRFAEGKKSQQPVAGAGWMRAPLALALIATAGTAFAQASAPAPGSILRDVEQSLPSQLKTSPDGAQVEFPGASVLDSVSSDERIVVRGFRISGSTAFDEETLQARVAGRTGEVSLADLNAAANAVTDYYRSNGYPLARAYLPKQEIENGVVTIAVLEGRYDQIATHNTARISDERVARTLRSALCEAGNECESALIQRRALERGLLLLSDTPGAQAAARLSPGATVGTSSLAVDASADRLASGSVQVDNGGSYYSGVVRAMGTLWINSPAGIGDQVTVQGLASANHGNLYYGSLGYGVPLGYSGARFAIRGSYLEYDLGDRYSILDARGSVRSTDGLLLYPFIRSRTANLVASVGYGERRFHDRADAIEVDNKRRIKDRADVGLNGDFRDELFGVPAQNTLSVVYTTGELLLDEILAGLDEISARSSGHYDKWGVSYSRLQPIASRTSLYLRAAAQGTSGNLDSYEKFALGGPDSVRAYPSGDTLADEAVLYTVELRQGFGIAWARALEGAVFYDRARGNINGAPWVSASNRATLSGVGIGLNCALTDRLTLRSSLAFRGNRRATAAPDSSYQYALSLNAAF